MATETMWLTNTFFSKLSGELHSAQSQPIIGTDEEKAMRKSIKTCFPDAPDISRTIVLLISKIKWGPQVQTEIE